MAAGRDKKPQRGRAPRRAAAPAPVAPRFDEDDADRDDELDEGSDGETHADFLPAGRDGYNRTFAEAPSEEQDETDAVARRSLSPKRRKRRSSELRNSLRLGVVLAALTGVNVYVFFFRADTSVKRLMEPQATSQSLVDEKKAAIAEPKAALEKGSPKGKGKAGASRGKMPAASGETPAGRGGASLSDPGEKPETHSEGGRSVEGKVGNKDTLGTLLDREGFGAVAANVVKALGRVVDPKSIQPGDDYLVSFDAEGAPEAFEYLPSPVLRYVVEPGPDGAWKARKEEKPLAVKAEQASGVIESSLYESVHKAGESSALASMLVDLFAWDINFYTDTHPQDHWKVVVEKQYLGGQFYKYGHILAAEYGGQAGTFRAFYWASGSGGGRYYDDKGQAIAKSMLKCPLRFVRISSKFDRNRFHPILHQTKAHLGIDYAAPTGTPVWASMGGKVVECGPKPGSGNTIVISHGSGLATRYYHLSRFAKGLKAGHVVKQKEVIGYVGTTGLSTGPHLHFSVTKNGGFVDPLKMNVMREAPVPDRAAYMAAIRGRVAQLKSLPPVVAKN